jgi:hypothetical protein
VPLIICRPKSLSLDQFVSAAKRAIEVNPENAREQRRVARTPVGRRGGPRRIAVVVGRKWPATGVKLSVSFLDNPSQALRKRIISHMNAWGESANVVFSETGGTGQVRIARLDSPASLAGYWSYIGTEILEIKDAEPTLNLEAFTMRTSDAEFRRVVRHETGHTLGFEHEHMRSDIVQRIDRAKAIAFYDKDQGWTPEEVEQQVLTPLVKKSLMGTKDSDPVSIMCYHLPASIMKDRKAIRGGTDINPRDAAFAAQIYPKTPPASKAPAATATAPAQQPTETASRAQPQGFTGDDVFYLSVLAPKADHAPAMLMANFRNASAMEVMYRGKKDIAKKSGNREPAAAAGLTAEQEKRAIDAGKRWERIIDTQKDIQKYVDGDPTVQELPDTKALMQLGSDLFEALLPGEVRRLYDAARAEQPGGRLNVVLTSQVSWMADLPWEFLYDPGRKTFLAASEVNFTRNVVTAIPAERDKPLDRTMRILVIVAQPLGLAHLSVEDETAVIKSGFQDLIDAKVAEVDVLMDATPALAHRTLEAVEYDIVHFIGHGRYDLKTDVGSLVFESGDEAEYKELEASVLQQIVCRRGIRLVFLNACETGRGGVVNFNSGVAPALVAGGVPAVVANQFSVLDVSATTFARHFYWALGCGQSIGDAAREARVAVNYSISGEAIDWAVPVVFARNPCAGIGIKKTQVNLERVVATRAPAGSRRRATNRIQVAIWDVQRMIPNLAEIAATLTRAQEKFEFRAVRFTAPLGTWRIEKKGEGKTYLMAEAVAKRLQDKPREFGADLLFAITNLPLRSAQKSYVQVWDRSPDKKIKIISIDGYLQNCAQDFSIEHLVANVVAAGLVTLNNHKSKPMNCLMFDNPPGDPAVCGRLVLCSVCKRQMQKKGEDSKSIEALLAAYPGV